MYPTSRQQAGQHAESLNLRQLLGYVRNLRWPAYLTATLLALTVLGTALMLSPSKNTVFGIIQVSSAPARMVFKTADNDGRNDFLTYIKTQAAQIKSRFVLNAALKSNPIQAMALLKDKTDPLGWIEENVKVTHQSGTELLSVSIDGPYPDEQLKLVDAIMNSYIQEVIENEFKMRNKRVAELEDIHVKLKEKLRAKKETIRRISQDLGHSDSEALVKKQVILLTTYGETLRQYQQIHFELLRTQARLKSMETDQPQPPAADEIEKRLQPHLHQDPLISQLTSKVMVFKEIELDYVKNARHADEPSLVRARQHIVELQRAIDERKQTLAQALVQDIQKQFEQERHNALNQMRREVDNLREQEKLLGAEVQRISEQTEKLGVSSTELEILKNEIQQEETLANRIGEEKDALQVELRSPPRAKIYQSASVIHKNQAQRFTLISGLTVFAFMATLSMFTLREMRKQKVISINQLAHQIDGTLIPCVFDKHANVSWDSRSSAATAGARFAADQGYSLLVNLLCQNLGPNQNTFFFCDTDDASSSHSLTHVTSCLLAERGLKTLFIDFHRHDTDTAAFFKIAAQPGCYDYLQHRASLPEIIQAAEIANLHVVAPGHHQDSLSYHLNGVAQMIAYFKPQYDVIVVKGNPFVEDSLTLEIANSCDSVLLAVQHNKSLLPSVVSAQKIFTSMGVNVLGMIPIDFPRQEIMAVC
ncbi:MAG: hypothetical protein ACK4RK_03450 [Gemmataceae bacterium]